jgi:hypothetical protein
LVRDALAKGVSSKISTKVEHNSEGITIEIIASAAWFEYAPEHSAAFEDLVRVLRDRLVGTLRFKQWSSLARSSKCIEILQEITFEIQFRDATRAQQGKRIKHFRHDRSLGDQGLPDDGLYGTSKLCCASQCLSELLFFHIVMQAWVAGEQRGPDYESIDCCWLFSR